MTEQSLPGASAPVASSSPTTAALPFSTSACSVDLFSVNPGIPAVKALKAASSYLTASLFHEDEDAWAMVYLVELAKALTDAVALGLVETAWKAADELVEAERNAP
jgi:hypothetical protein